MPKVWVDLDDGYEYSLICNVHPNYTLQRQPTSSCRECRIMWEIVEDIRRTRNKAVLDA